MHKSRPWKAGPAIPACLITIILALAQTARADEQNPISILYYEPIQLAGMPSTAQQLPTGAEFAPLVFDAYGRRFELQPSESQTLSNSEFIQIRGRLAGLAGSWFSLLRNGEELSGIIADGEDTYLIEPHYRVAELLTETFADNAPPTNVIFRLADMLIPQGLLSCATQDDALPASIQIDGQSAVNKLGAELQAAPNDSTASNLLALHVGVIADRSFTDRHAEQTESEIAAIFNTVQGIMANEIGLEIKIDSVLALTPDVSNPFSDTVVATNLLDELGSWRNRHQSDLGHTHLLTVRNLINDEGDQLAGISYLGVPGRSGACISSTGASLSKEVRGLTALVVTHEIGHNLGAPHDGDPAGACASAPENEFIMSPRVSHRTAMEFSDCSIARFNSFITAASCLDETTQKLPANSGSGGGGGTLGWLSIAGLLTGMILRRRRNARIC